ncbi:MAG: winged helix-turn-helix transcriptional regulator [Labilithrix sp.]|nr:winged helix-turn-helix transcriptional regulator [Labilithrix sp.]
MADPLLVFARALAHPVRLRLLGMLGDHGLGVAEVARTVGVASATAHHHLAHLVRAGLVDRVQVGNRIVYRWGPTRWTITPSSAEHEPRDDRA